MEYSFEKVVDKIEMAMKEKGHQFYYDQIRSKRMQEKMDEEQEKIEMGKKGTDRTLIPLDAKAPYEKIYDANILKQTTSDAEHQYPAPTKFAREQRRLRFFFKCAFLLVTMIVSAFSISRYRKWRDDAIEAQLAVVRKEILEAGERRAQAASS